MRFLAPENVENSSKRVKYISERKLIMTLYTEVVSKVKHMSQDEKLALLKMLADSLNQENHQEKRKHTLKSLYGALRPANSAIPTDEQLEAGYITYLESKYK